MNIKAMDIYNALIEANGINKNLYPTQRIAIQTKAITYYVENLMKGESVGKS